MVVVDDEDRENEGDLIFAAEMATPELVSFMVRYTSGYICVALTEPERDRLDLPPMHHTNDDLPGTAFTVTVDAKAGITPASRPADRAHTIRLLADPAPGPADLVAPRPRRSAAGPRGRRAAPSRAHRGRGGPGPAGRARAGRRALRDRARRTTQAWRAATSCGVFADDHELTLITIADLIAYRRRFEKQVDALRRPGSHRAWRVHRLRLRSSS